MVFLALAIAASLARAQSGNNLEVIHHPNYDKSVFMPFSPAIKVKSGKLQWLAGGTALPLGGAGAPDDGRDGILQTLKAANASPKDDIGKASAIVNSYFAPYNHKPATTNMAALELGEPEQLVERFRWSP